MIFKLAQSPAKRTLRFNVRRILVSPSVVGVRNQNRVTQTWLVCAECNQRLLDTEFKSEARSAFESYQAALRPFLGGRQIALGFGG